MEIAYCLFCVDIINGNYENSDNLLMCVMQLLQMRFVHPQFFSLNPKVTLLAK